MSKVLADGTVIPSGLRTVKFGENNAAFQAQFQNFSIRAGYISRIIPPGANQNISKKHFEYDVVVSHRDANRNVTGTTMYYNCRVARLFGGKADFTSYTLRPTKTGGEATALLETGSNVFVMCENGNSSRAYIIGSPEHPGQQPDYPDHHYLFQFNGVSFFIDEHGGLRIDQLGPTDEDGKAVGNTLSSSIVLESNGDITINDGRGQMVRMGSDTTTVMAKGTVVVDAPRIEVGDSKEALAPVMRATESHEKAIHDLNSALKDVSAGLAKLCSQIAAEPTLGPSKAGAGELLARLQLLNLAIDTYDQSVSTDDAISTKQFSE